MKTHLLKTEARFFEQVSKGNKTAEVRRFDRDFQAGDFLILEEVVSVGVGLSMKATGRSFHSAITHVLPSNEFEGIAEGFCLLSMNGGRLFEA